MDDEYPPEPRLWLRINAVLHVVRGGVLVVVIAVTVLFVGGPTGLFVLPWLLILLSPLWLLISGS